MANIKPRRKLSDLYKKGVEIRFGSEPDGTPFARVAPLPEGKPQGRFLDEQGDPLPLGEGEIQMWIQPPSPLQREMAMRDAQAARAKSLIRAKRDEGSEEHLTILAFLADMSDETLVDYILLQEHETRQSEAIREVLAEDEWKDMESYRDAIRGYDEKELPLEELEKDPEWVALMELDAKFGDQVAKRADELAESARDALRMQLQAGRGNLERKALAKRAEMVATQAFMYEYELQMAFYSARDFEDNGVLFFESAFELANEDEQIREAINEANALFITNVGDAKNLPGAASGSDSSEPPNKQETSAASTPEVVNA